MRLWGFATHGLLRKQKSLRKTAEPQPHACCPAASHARRPAADWDLLHRHPDHLASRIAAAQAYGLCCRFAGPDKRRALHHAPARALDCAFPVHVAIPPVRSPDPRVGDLYRRAGKRGPAWRMATRPLLCRHRPHIPGLTLNQAPDLRIWRNECLFGYPFAAPDTVNNSPDCRFSGALSVVVDGELTDKRRHGWGPA